MASARYRNARAEASARVGDRFDVRVLEPSPPPVLTPPFFADDPLEGGQILPVRRAGSRTWSDLCDETGDASLLDWCWARWLVPAPLDGLPPGFVATRDSLHAVAEQVLAPARYQATQKIGLRFTYRGFGTPFFRGPTGGAHQLRIEDGLLVDGRERKELTTIADAADFVGVPPGVPAHLYTPGSSWPLDEPLIVDVDAARALGEWFGFSTWILEQLRAESDQDDKPGRLQLWTEHFDMAVDLGPEGARANFGGSPGDAAHADPYLYVGPWEARQGKFWNEPFGASLSLTAILNGADPLAFCRQGKALLREGELR
jgi:hypothetical protein